jgi:hypothetical protein
LWFQPKPLTLRRYRKHSPNVNGNIKLTPFGSNLAR